MQLIHQIAVSKLILTFILFSNMLIAQTEYSEYTLKKNSDVISQHLMNLEGQNIIFFIGNRHDSVKFNEKVKELQKSPTMKLVKDANIHFVFFKESTKNNSEGILIKSDPTLSRDSSIYVNQLEVFFSNYEEKKIARATRELTGSFYYEKPFEGQDLYRMNIVDTTSCYPNIPERIPFYRKIINVLHNPKYSDEEKANFYTDTISLKLNENIDSMEFKLDSLEKEIEYQKLRIEELEKYMQIINGKKIDKLKEERKNKDNKKSRKVFNINIFKKD